MKRLPAADPYYPNTAYLYPVCEFCDTPTTDPLLDSPTTLYVMLDAEDSTRTNLHKGCVTPYERAMV